jgi:hypothetical protein
MRGYALFVLSACGRLGFESTEQVSADANEPLVTATRGTLDNGIGNVLVDAPQLDAPALVCAASYTLVAGTSFYRVGAATSWTEAEAACESDGVGMHLAVIADFVEQQKIEGFVGGMLDTWIGVTDRKTDNTFLDVTGGATTYLPWAANFPNFAGAGCVFLDPAARKYHDGACTQLLEYVCECDLVAADPASY